MSLKIQVASLIWQTEIWNHLPQGKIISTGIIGQGQETGITHLQGHLGNINSQGQGQDQQRDILVDIPETGLGLEIDIGHTDQGKGQGHQNIGQVVPEKGQGHPIAEVDHTGQKCPKTERNLDQNLMTVTIVQEKILQFIVEPETIRTII